MNEQKYTVEQTANFIRSNPNYSSTYNTNEWEDDNKLVNHWIDKFPQTKHYLTELPQGYKPATSYDRPDEAAGNIDKATFNIKSQIANMPPMMAGIATAILDDRNMVMQSDQAIRSWEDKLKELEANPNSDPKRIKYIKEQHIPSLYKRRNQQQELSSQNTARDWMYGNAKDISITWRDASNEYLDALIQNDPEMQARLKWEQDNPIDSFSALFGSTDMLTRAITELGSSMALTIGPSAGFKLLAGASNLAKFTSAADKLNKISSITGNSAVTTSVMFAMEGGGIYKEVMDYLTQEYKYTNPDGDMITGLAPQDAMLAASMVTANYGVLATILERFQVNQTAAALGLKKGMKSAMITRLSDKVMEKLPIEYGTSGLMRIAGSVANVGLMLGEEGLVEGWQAGMEHLHTEAVKEGYGVDMPNTIQNLYTELGYKAKEIGVSNIALPYQSNIPMVRESFYVGLGGSVGPGSINLSRDVLNNINEMRNGDDVVLEKSKDGQTITLRNETKNTVTMVPTGNKQEQDDLQAAINSNLTGDQTIIELASVDSAEDYAEILISYANGDESSMYIDDLVDQFDESEIKASKLKQMIFRDSGKNTKRRPLPLSKAITNLVNFTGDAEFLHKLKTKEGRTQGEVDVIDALIASTANDIRNTTVGKLKNKITKGNAISGANKIQELVSSMPADKVIEKSLGGVLDNEIADKINQAEDDFFIKGAEKAEPVEPTPIAVERMMQSQEIDAQRQAEEALFSKLKQRKVSKARNTNQQSPIADINDSKNVSVARLFSHLIGEAFDPDTDNATNVKNINDTILGNEGNPRMNNTQLVRLAKKAKVPVDKKKLAGKAYGYRKSIANKIATKLVGQLNPTPAKVQQPKQQLKVQTKPSPAEIITEKKAPLREAKKAPAVDPLAEFEVSPEKLKELQSKQDKTIEKESSDMKSAKEQSQSVINKIDDDITC